MDPFSYPHKAIVLSDTHGDIAAIERLLPVINACDLLIHLGDYNRDVLWLRHQIVPPMCCVAGNGDFGSYCPTEAVETLGGKRIFLTHGHLLGARGGVDRIVARAAELDCSIALYGHTHVAKIAATGAVPVMNPGSLSRPRAGAPSYGLLYGADKFFLKIVPLDA